MLFLLVFLTVLIIGVVPSGKRTFPLLVVLIASLINLIMTL